MTAQQAEILRSFMAAHVVGGQIVVPRQKDLDEWLRRAERGNEMGSWAAFAIWRFGRALAIAADLCGDRESARLALQFLFSSINGRRFSGLDPVVMDRGICPCDMLPPIIALANILGHHDLAQSFCCRAQCLSSPHGAEVRQPRQIPEAEMETRRKKTVEGNLKYILHRIQKDEWVDIDWDEELGR